MSAIKPPAERATDRRRAIAASIPPVLVGLGIGLATAGLVAFGRPPHVLGVAWPAVPSASALVAALMLLAVLVLGAARAATDRLPTWAYSWIGADMVALVVAMNVLTEDRDAGHSPVAAVVALGLFLLAGATVLGRAAWRGWWPAGLLSAGLCATLALAFCFWVGASPAYPELGLLAAPLGLLLGGLLFAYARGSGAAAVAALAAIVVANAGIAWAAELSRRSWMLCAPPTGRLCPMLLLCVGPLLIGPLLGMLLGRLRRAVSQRVAGS